MFRTLKSPAFSMRLQHPRHEHGVQTSVLQPTRQIILNRNREIKFPASRHRFISSCSIPTRDLDIFGVAESVSEPKDDYERTLQSVLWRNWDTFYRFSRLYSAIGAILGVCSISLLPLTSVGEISPAFVLGTLQVATVADALYADGRAVVPFAFANVYVGAINQVYDVGIDKINKPYLPLASGEYSMFQGKAITAAFGIMCLAMGIMFKSPPLFIGILVCFLLGTAYSVELPLLRWKTKPHLAVLCTVGFYGLSIPIAVFFHIQKYVLGKPIVLTKSLGFAVISWSLFSTVLGMFKDIPDVEGDREFGNQTFSVRHAKDKVFSLCINLLLIGYGSAAVLGASSSNLLCKLVSVIGHCTLGSILWFRANSLNLDDNPSVQSFYMFLWKLLYAEYALTHFIR